MASPQHDQQRGSTTIEMVILFPVLLIMLFGTVQTGLWFNARNIAITAAQTGAREAAAYESSPAAGRAAALELATSAGAHGTHVDVSSTATTTTVAVRVDSPNLMPWLIPAWTIEQSATMPLERITR